MSAASALGSGGLRLVEQCRSHMRSDHIHLSDSLAKRRLGVLYVMRAACSVATGDELYSLVMCVSLAQLNKVPVSLYCRVLRVSL